MRASALHSQKLKILLTGASGFIGQHTLSALLSTPHYITALSRDPSKITPHKNLEIIKADIYDPYFCLNAKYDILIHLAWEGLPNYQQMFHLERNLMANYTFIKNAIHSGIKNITISGTCFEYGIQNGCLSESSPTAPNTTYAMAKDFLHKMLQELCKHEPFNLQWLRLWYVYGKGQSKSSILSQLQASLDNKEQSFKMSRGEQLRDYLDVKQMAHFIANIATHLEFSGVCNICSNEPIAIRTLVENYLKTTNQHIKLDFGTYPYSNYEPLAFWGDNTKLLEILSGGGAANLSDTLALIFFALFFIFWILLFSNLIYFNSFNSFVWIYSALSLALFIIKIDSIFILYLTCYLVVHSKTPTLTAYFLFALPTFISLLKDTR